MAQEEGDVGASEEILLGRQVEASWVHCPRNADLSKQFNITMSTGSRMVEQSRHMN